MYWLGVYVGGVIFCFAVMLIAGVGRMPVGTWLWRAAVTAVLWPVVITIGLFWRFREWQDS